MLLKMRTFLLISILTAGQFRSNGQVLISILLGDKLNSDKLEFGLDGGLNLADTRGLDNSSSNGSLSLGFYFDIRLFENRSWMLHTGMLVKSTMGADDLPVYSLGNPDLDNAFAGGSVSRQLGYFNVPVMMKYQWANHFFVEAGPMFGLMNKATDNFTAKVVQKEDLNYKLKIRDRYHPLDAGMMAGIGYRLLGGNGMNIGARYYYGFVDITIDDSSANEYNNSFFIFAEIPIGVGKKASKPE
jgi:hypothetical protein